MRSSVSSSVDEYIRGFPPEVRRRLEQIRQVILAEVDDPEEKISYRMPTIVWHGKRVHFAGFSRHTGLYPGAAAMERFDRELAGYVHGRGSIQFPHDAPLPVGLIRRIVRARVGEPPRGPAK